jgi:hypothetical protein
MLFALLILGVAGASAVLTAMNHTRRTHRVYTAVANKARLPKLMGVLVLGMQAGELANHVEHVTMVTWMSVVFAATIWGAMKMRSGVKHKLL